MQQFTFKTSNFPDRRCQVWATNQNFNSVPTKSRCWVRTGQI